MYNSDWIKTKAKVLRSRSYFFQNNIEILSTTYMCMKHLFNTKFYVRWVIITFIKAQAPLLLVQRSTNGGAPASFFAEQQGLSSLCYWFTYIQEHEAIFFSQGVWNLINALWTRFQSTCATETLILQLGEEKKKYIFEFDLIH